MYEDIQIEMARTMRELEQRVIRRVASKQIGEAFVNLPVANERRGQINMKEAA